MEHGKASIFGRVVWIFVITGMILVGCGTKEVTLQATSVPANTMENEISIATPGITPVVATSTEAPVLPSPTTQPALEPSPTLAPAIIPTDTSLPTPVAMSLMDWTLWGWTSSTSPMACQDTNSACWMLTDYRSTSSLEGVGKITVDPSWKSPSLVFQTRYSIKEAKAFGYVEIEVEGEVGWNRVYSLKGSRDYWHEVAIDLSQFSGKTISLRFSTKPYVNIIQVGEATKMVYNKQTWIIQNINIVSK